MRARDLASYLPLIRVLATRDLKARYKQTVLGPAWVLFQPLALLVAFSVGFRNIAHVRTDGVPYAVFALVGLAVWTYFQATMTVATSSIIANFSLVRWTACPRLALPLSTLAANLPSLAVPTVGAVIVAGTTGHLNAAALLLPLLVLWALALFGAIAVFLASIAVRAHDVASVAPFLLQVALFLSPVAYGTSTLHHTLRTLIAINPLTGVIEVWRWAILGLPAETLPVATSAGITVLGLLAAWRTFKTLERSMADEI